MNVRTADVFVSYRRADSDTVLPLARALELRGLDVWIDTRSIAAGQRWQDLVAEGVLGAAAFVIVVGGSGIDRVQADELRIVLERSYDNPDLPIVPVLLPGGRLDGDLAAYLRTRSWILVPEQGIDDGLVDTIADAARGLGVGVSASPSEPLPNPYPGLRAFQRADSGRFFGRTEETQALVGMLSRPGLVAVVGPSGAGKSSVVAAGVLPRLGLQDGSGRRPALAIVFEPGADPLRSLAVALVSEAGHEWVGLDHASGSVDAVREVARSLSSGSCALADAISLIRARPDGEQRTVLVVDQLEQMFTRCRDEELRRAFVDNLCLLATSGLDDISIVVTLRSDYLTELAAHRELATLVTERHLLLGPLTVAGLRDAVQQPAWDSGVALEPALVDRIVADVQDQPHALPLLAVALQAMWEHRSGDRLTLAAYEAGGGVRGALVTRAEAAIEPFRATDEPLVRSTLLRLVHLTSGGGAARERVADADLVPADEHLRATVASMVDALASARLVVRDRDEVSGQPTVELSHDALLTCWDRLVRWIAEARRLELPRRRLAEAARLWEANDRSSAFVAPAGLLAEAEQAVGSGFLAATASEIAFLEASRSQHRRLTRRRWITAGLAVCVVGALIAVALFARQSSRQRRAADVAFAQELASTATRELAERPDAAMLLAAEARSRADTPATRSALATTLGRAAQLTGQRSLGFPVEDAAVGGSTALVSGHDQSVQACDLSSGQCRPWAPAGSASVTSIAIDEGGTYAAIALANGDVLAGPVSSTPAKLASVASATTVSFGGDTANELLLVGTSSGSVAAVSPGDANPTGLGSIAAPVGATALDPSQTWLVATNRLAPGFSLLRFDGGPAVSITAGLGHVEAVAFSPDGRTLAVAEGDRNDILVWDVEALSAAGEDAPALRLAGHDRPLRSLEFSTASELWSGDDSGVVRRWDLERGVQLGDPLTARLGVGQFTEGGTSGAILAMEPEEESLVAVRDDGSIVEWDARRRPSLASSVADVPGATSVASNGTVLVVAGENGDLRMTPVARDAAGGLALDAASESVATFPSGVQDLEVAAVADDGTVFAGGTSMALIDGTTGQVEATATAVDTPVTTAAFLPGERGDVVIGHANGTVERLDGGTLRSIATLPSTTGDPVGAIAVAPDGRVAVARGTSIEVRSDDLGTSLVTLQGHQASVDSLAFARDGELLASGSDDRTISLWDTGSWTQLRTLFGHNDKVTGLSFAAEDRLLASVSQDGTLRLWDPPTGQPIGGPMRTDTRAIDNIVTVGPSATVALTLAGDDVTTWDLDVDGWAGRACALAGRALSEEEWAVYSDGRPYEPSCER